MVENSKAMIDGIIEGYMEVYGANPPELIARAPGRVEVIGGHTDYNEGYVIATAIDKSCWVAAAVRTDKKIIVYSQLLKEQKEFELSKELKATSESKWLNYVIGVAAVLMQEGLELRGQIYIWLVRYHWDRGLAVRRHWRFRLQRRY
jgi:galactokinase